MSDDILERYTRGNQPAPIADGSFTPTDIFSKYDRSDSAPEVKASPSWQDAEALENLAAQGTSSASSEPKKPGRGILQAIKDYPGHVLSGLVDTSAAPGNVLTSTKPSTSESLIPSAVGIAGLVGGTEFPRVGGAALAEKGLTKVAPSSQAVNKLVEAIRPENVPEVVASMRANPRMSAADLSDPVRIDTQGLMAKGTPDVQDLISRATRDRIGSRPEAVNTAYTQAMGAAPDVPKMVEGLKQRATDIGQGIIQPVVKAAKPVDVTPVISAIDKEIGADPVGRATLKALKAGEDPAFPLSDYQRRLFELRQDLRGTWKDRDQMFLDAGGEQGAHWIQAKLRAEAQNLLSSATGTDRNLGGKLMDMRSKIVDQIDKASGGEYKPALSKFRDSMQVGEAFEAGFDTLKNRSGLNGALEDSPQAFKNWMANASPEEVVARRLGTRADIDRKINGVKNGALAGETVTKIPYNQEKLQALFGDKEAGRLIQVMQDSQREATTNAAILHGSKTAETTASGDRIKVRDVGGGNPLQYITPVAAEMLGSQYGVPGIGLLMGATKAAHLGAQKVGQILDKKTNLEYARNALATGPAREETIDRLLSHPKVVREFKKRANALTAP